MGKKNRPVGICAVCGEQKPLTFEHIPPKAAYNTEPVYVKDHRHLIPMGGHLFGKSMRSNRGFGGFWLCESCNNHTGKWYAEEYVRFVRSTFEFISSHETASFVSFSRELYPLQLLKQIFVFHLCADKIGVLRSELSMTSYILNRTNKHLPPEIRIFMYATLSPTHRFNGLSVCTIQNGRNFGKYSEVNFHPFGFLLAWDSPAPIGSVN